MSAPQPRDGISARRETPMTMFTNGDLRCHARSDGKVGFEMMCNGRVVASWQQSPDLADEFAVDLATAARTAREMDQKNTR